MKKHTQLYSYILLLIFGLAINHAQGQDSIQIQIKIEQLEKAPIVLNYNDFGQFKSIKGTELSHNEYLFKIPNIGYTYIQFLVNSPKNLFISESGFTPKSMTKVLVSPKEKTFVRVKNGDQFDIELTSNDKEVKLFEKYAAAERQYYKQAWDELNNRKDGLNNSNAKENTASFETIKENFVQKHNKSFASLAVFSTYYTRLPASVALDMLNTLAPKHPNSPLRLAIAEKLESTLLTTSGNKIPSFQVKDLHGITFSSDAIPSKYLLIDFWGSWCQPCRASHPELKKIYDKYKPLGLEILGIAFESGSLENQQNNWKKAINEDKINWINTLNSAENNIVKKFGITSYPTKILVDASGNIIYRSGQNEDSLEDILQKLFM